MKTILSVLLLGMTLTLSAQTQSIQVSRFQGQPITGVKANSTFKVEIYQSDQTSAWVEIPVQWQQNLIFEIDAEGVVQIGLKLNKKQKASLKKTSCLAKVYVKQLHILQANEAAQITAHDIFSGTSTQITCYSAGKINNLILRNTGKVSLDLSSASRFSGQISAPFLECDLSSIAHGELSFHGQQLKGSLSSIAKLFLTGEATNLTLDASSFSSCSGSDFSAETASLIADTGSKIRLGIVKQLDANTSMGGKIRYRETPHIQSILTTPGGNVSSY